MDGDDGQETGDGACGENPSSSSSGGPRGSGYPLPNSRLQYAELCGAVLGAESISGLIPEARLQGSSQGSSDLFRCYVQRGSQPRPQPLPRGSFNSGGISTSGGTSNIGGSYDSRVFYNSGGSYNSRDSSNSRSRYNSRGSSNSLPSNPSQVFNGGDCVGSCSVEDELQPQPNPRSLSSRDEGYSQEETGPSLLEGTEWLELPECHVQSKTNSSIELLYGEASSSNDNNSTVELGEEVLEGAIDQVNPPPNEAISNESLGDVVNSFLNLEIFDESNGNVTRKNQYKEKNGFTHRTESNRSLGKDVYIKGIWENGKLLRLDSCEFSHPFCNKVTYIRRQDPGYLLTYDNDDFLARVSFNKLEEIDFLRESAVDIKRNLINKLVFTRIITDRLLEFRDTAYEDFIEILRKAAKETAYNIHSAEDIFQIFNKLQRWRFWPNNSISQEIINNSNISDRTKGYCNAFMENEIALSMRNKHTRAYQLPPKNLYKDLQDICEIGITSHKKVLDGKYMRTIFLLAPHSMPDHLSFLKDEIALIVRGKDIEMFADLVLVMCEEPYIQMVSKVWDGFFKRLKKIKLKNEDISLKKFLPLINPVYFYLCKSFQELASEISSKINISVNDLLMKNIKNIELTFVNHLEFCLIKQCKIIYKLMNYFSPANNSEKSEFPHDFQIVKMSANSPPEQSYDGTFGFLRRLLRNPTQKPDLPDDRLAWLGIADYAISNLISKNVIEWNPMLEALFDGYTKFLTEMNEDNHESFRILTHSLVKFIAQTGPYFSQEMTECSQKILEKQIRSIINAIERNEFFNFRDIINVYYEFWKQGNPVIHNIIDKFPFGNFKKNMEEISQLLLNIVETPFCIEATSEELITYFRSVNDFLCDINSVKFIWYIKKDLDLIEESIELVNESKGSYEVLDPEKFITKQNNIPRHYIIEIIKELLNCVNNLLQQKKWSNGNNLNPASILFSEMKRCFLYLKEQPDYTSFEIFKDETIKPFLSTVEKSISLQDFEKRIRIVGGSFWYLRKQNEINVEKALDLYQKCNHVSGEANDILRICYNIYLEKFNSLIQQTSEASYKNKIRFIISDVQEILTTADINKWDKALKEETIPKLIAGLAAIWSLAESKDLEGTGQCLKPHCIQILCIFRLLSIDDNSEVIDKHLVEVLTGQGKSLILGLLSALLALLGKNIRVVCYSEYLATRDEEDFNFLFELLNIKNKISYGTFKDMANELLRRDVGGIELGLRELVRNRVLNEEQEGYREARQKDVTNTILLIDEVDVFFSETFYGSSYNPCVSIRFPALATIQEVIWDMVTKKSDKNNISKKIDILIKEKVEKRDYDFIFLNKCIRQPGEKVYLKETKNDVIENQMTNFSLFEQEFYKMIDEANLIANAKENDCFIRDYRLDDEGYITYKDDIDMHYTRYTLNGYKNVFNYFRLKKVDFDHKRCANYGYLLIHCGNISYAKLPEKYPVILGVSGTITSLNDYERKAIEEYYNIKKRSIMPSFFGRTNLKFDKYNDVILGETEDDWLNKIYSFSNEEISRDRAVIIFFANDMLLNKFKEKYFGKFDRLHVLTENTRRALKEKYVDEAGICRTVTLGTAGMGRGTDFKSSAGVERVGGVHVIQSFLSPDPKEETQLRGRTARKDNQGSYQLVLCREHLVRSLLLTAEEGEGLDYDKLCELRARRQATLGKDLDERITKIDKNHKTTMCFLESFFEN